MADRQGECDHSKVINSLRSPTPRLKSSPLASRDARRSFGVVSVLGGDSGSRSVDGANGLHTGSGGYISVRI